MVRGVRQAVPPQKRRTGCIVSLSDALRAIGGATGASARDALLRRVLSTMYVSNVPSNANSKMKKRHNDGYEHYQNSTP